MKNRSSCITVGPTKSLVQKLTSDGTYDLVVCEE